MHCNLFRYFRFARCEIFSFPDHFSFGASSAAYQIDKNYLNRSILMKFNYVLFFYKADGIWTAKVQTSGMKQLTIGLK